MTQNANKPAGSQREQRIIVGGQMEVRSKADGTPQITGYAAVFNQPSEIIDDWLGGFIEYCAPGCFTKTLADGADVRALFNHDPNFVLGRTRSGTLACSEDAHGLHYDISPPNTQWARDLMETMRRGDVSQSSFAFRTVRDRWGTTPGPDGEAMDTRTLLECQLYDVSPVAYPAYPQTDSAVRSLLDEFGIGGDKFLKIVYRLQRGLTVTPADHDILRRTIDQLAGYLPKERRMEIIVEEDPRSDPEVPAKVETVPPVADAPAVVEPPVADIPVVEPTLVEELTDVLVDEVPSIVHRPKGISDRKKKMDNYLQRLARLDVQIAGGS